MNLCVRWDFYDRQEKGETWVETRKDAMALIKSKKSEPEVSRIDLTTYGADGMAKTNWNWSRLIKGSRVWEKAQFA